jgi:TRAP-type mannitol/chloroaromatic compound transport system substrate-binding protein
MKRRDFLHSAGAAVVAAAPGLAGAAPAVPGKSIEWKMVTAWPKHFPGAGTGAERLARRIGEMSGGRLTIKVYAAGELVPAFEVFDAVSRGTAEMGHAASAYWVGKMPAAQFFGGVPFGMTTDELNAWLYDGGGLALWREVYAPLGVIPLPVGNAGVQMAGWFRRQIDSVNDLKGMKIRVQGLAAEVLGRAGATPVSMPAGEIFTSLQSGLIDAAEFTGPYNDLALGIYKAAKYYYYPGWHEPSTTAECLLNRKAFEGLPRDLQSIVSTACQAMNVDMFAEYTARSNLALQTLVNEHQVQLRRLPDSVIDKLRTLSADVLDDLAARDATARKVYAAYTKFRKQVAGWTDVSEYAFLKARS